MRVTLPVSCRTLAGSALLTHGGSPKAVLWHLTAGGVHAMTPSPSRPGPKGSPGCTCHNVLEPMLLGLLGRLTKGLLDKLGANYFGCLRDGSDPALPEIRRVPKGTRHC